MSNEGHEGHRSRWSPAARAASASRRPCGCKKAGFTTYAVARRVDRMAGLEAEGVHAFAMDVTDEASMVGGIERIIAEQGRIDVLVNNAGYGSYGAVEDVPLEEARRQFEVNLFGLARLVQLVTPHMREQKIGPDHQHLLGRGGDLRAVRRVVPRHQVRGRRVQRQPAGRAAAVRHRRRASCTRPGSSPSGTRSPATSLVDRSKDGVYAASAVKAAKAMESVDNPRHLERARGGGQGDRQGGDRAAAEVALLDRQGREHGDDGAPRAAGPRVRRDPHPALPGVTRVR